MKEDQQLNKSNHIQLDEGKYALDILEKINMLEDKPIDSLMDPISKLLPN